MKPEISAGMRDYLASYRYKLELHAHTSPVSPCSRIPPAELIERLHAKGYHGVVITNHFYRGARFWNTPDPIGTYLADYRAAKEAAKAYGMSVLLGAEYRFADNGNDYLVFGIDEDFLRETADCFDMTIGEFYEACHSKDRLIVQAHPFRDSQVRANPAHLDGVEIFNLHPHHNSRIGLAAAWAKDAGKTILTVGTDLHEPDHEGLCATRTRILPQSGAELVALLREQDYLMEIGGCPVLPFEQF